MKSLTRKKALAITALVVGFLGCSPALNWRDVQLDSGMRGLLPCKPDQTQRAQDLAGRTLQVEMMGCEAADALWALATADMGVGDPAASYTALQQAWQTGLLQALRGSVQGEAKPYPLAADPGAPGVAVTLVGSSVENRPLKANALWFSRGGRIYLAVVYAERVHPDALETFWSNVRGR